MIGVDAKVEVEHGPHRAVFLVDPVVIAVAGIAFGAAVVLLAGPSLQAVAAAAAIVAGWSSAWSP